MARGIERLGCRARGQHHGIGRGHEVARPIDLSIELDGYGQAPKFALRRFSTQLRPSTRIVGKGMPVNFQMTVTNYGGSQAAPAV